MKVSKVQASDNRDAIVQAAASQIRRRGFSQMSVAEVAKAAGLTHGALYSHFGSKDALQAEATERAFADCLADFSGLSIDQFLARYLSAEHRDNAEQGCPTAALAWDVRWQSEQSRTAFKDGFERFVVLLQDSLRSTTVSHGRDRVLMVFAAMIGGMAIARAICDIDEHASDDALRAVADQLRKVIDEPGDRREAAVAGKPGRQRSEDVTHRRNVKAGSKKAVVKSSTRP